MSRLNWIVNSAGTALVVSALLSPGLAGAQQPEENGPPGPPPPMQSNRPPMERAFHGGPGERFGRWWDNPRLSEELNLSADQKNRMDAIFQQSRLKLIDLHASVQKEEATLEPLLSADTPEESKILTQIDRVAQARAELEKANARMLLSIRQVLTPEQWTKLKAEREARMTRGSGMGPRE